MQHHLPVEKKFSKCIAYLRLFAVSCYLLFLLLLYYYSVTHYSIPSSLLLLSHSLRPRHNIGAETYPFYFLASI